MYPQVTSRSPEVLFSICPPNDGYAPGADSEGLPESGREQVSDTGTRSEERAGEPTSALEAVSAHDMTVQLHPLASEITLSVR